LDLISPFKMKKMKKIKFLITCMVLFAGTSCNKQLNTVPTDFVSSIYYYNNADELNMGLAGIYDILGDQTTYAASMLYNLSYTNDEGIMVHGAFIPASNFSYDPGTPELVNLWNTLYRGINNANILLEAIDAPNADKVSLAIKENIRAQTLFLRAFYFYMLADRWGDVPLRLTPTKSADDVNFARTPLKEVFAQIVKDMTYAAQKLPKASVLGSSSSGRLSKNAAQGILARVNLSMAGFPLNDESKYADAKAWCDSVMRNGENSLNPSYSDNFVKQARNEYYVPENIWEVEFYGNTFDNHFEGGYVGIRNGIISGDNGLIFPGYGYNVIDVSIMLYNSYQKNPVTLLSNDLRMARNIAPYYWSGANITTKTMVKNYWPYNANIYQRYPGKWRRDEELLLPRGKNSNSTNFPLLRFSDVLLMYAEAENYINGPTAAAYNAINQVRERAYGSGYRVISITLTNGGSGYPTQAPTAAIPVTVDVTFDKSSDANGASTAEAYTTVAGGKVTAITLVNMGGFYSATPPKVTITSTTGAGVGATATATVEAINPAEADLTPGLSKDDFFKAIMDERARELCFECLRSQDLRRWGILIPKMQELATSGEAAPAGTIRTAYTSPAINIGERNLYYPIPSTEKVTNALIIQNPGW
jgi:hypothetical protein